MSLLQESEFPVVEAVAALLDCNPFLPERSELEARVLGEAFVSTGRFWHSAGDAFVSDPNRPLLCERVDALADTLRSRLHAGVAPQDAEMRAYRGLVLYHLWLRYEDRLYNLVEPESPAAACAPVEFFEAFAADVDAYLGLLPGPPPDAAHLFAVAFQARRAFHHIFRRIFGGSLPAARLRADVWTAIFTTEPADYRADMFERLRDNNILITGEPGTGKELVARAIGLSQYIPFDAATRTFVASAEASLYATNLSALNVALFEAELFGHRRGAFTGADRDHAGWLESCGPYGTVFLDEVGELEAGVQVKLLRVLQTRIFQRVGETEPRRFEGKVISATNRDLAAEMRAGRFRPDFYDRISADLITTPTLRAQLADCPDDLHNLVLITAQRVVGPRLAAARAEKVVRYIHEQLDADYRWPGNMRELEKCVRRVCTRGSYVPLPVDADDESAALVERMRQGGIPMKELTARYVRMTHERIGSIRETARCLGLSRDIVAKILKEEANGGQEGEA